MAKAKVRTVSPGNKKNPATFPTVKEALRKLGDPNIAEHSQRFFKTGKGEYGEGDKFLGIRVPVIRQQVKTFKELSLEDTIRVLQSDYHEERLFALLMLVHKFQRGDEQLQKKIYQVYLDNTERINNWDLVDSSAHLIVGAYLENRSREKLYQLAKSKDLWRRRIAIMATFCFIKKNDFEDALAISTLLLSDEHDLIHKAVGWMVREVGNRDVAMERAFLKSRYKAMPRTMLRYAIEKFPESERKRYLNGTI
jgi:3-methyladenine DNA glycosylase AlkD